MTAPNDRQGPARSGDGPAGPTEALAAGPGHPYRPITPDEPPPTAVLPSAPPGPAEYATTALDPLPDRAMPQYLAPAEPVGESPAAPNLVIHNEIAGRTPPSTGSVLLTAFVCFVLGLILAGAGGYLVARFGNFNSQGVTVANGILTIVGGVLLFAAVLLNGFSAWATVVPGLVFAVFGAWMLFDPVFAKNVADDTIAAFPNRELQTWGQTGWLFALGLVLVAAGIAAALARSAGKRNSLA